MFILEGKYNTATVFTDNIESEAISQIVEICNQEAFKNSTIRIMPDVHPGAGCVIGFTANLGDKVVPNLIGVDIGCGMFTVKLGKIDINFEKIDKFIRNNIPLRNKVNSKEQPMPEHIRDKILLLSERFNSEPGRQLRSLGSLGGGNHFIEISSDSRNDKYLVIHSGSRELGLMIANYYQNMAIDYCKNMRNQFKNEKRRYVQSPEKEMSINPYQNENIYKVPKELSFLKGQLATYYKNDMKFAQEFASLNRIFIAKRIVKQLGLNYDELDSFTTIHNYIDFEDNIIRKGAISAKEGELVLIPINMRDGSILAKGKGNKDWNNSAPHGAGRLFSRGRSKELFSLEEFEESMKGIYSTSVKSSTIDEAPFAYKPMQEILENIQPTVEVIDILEPLYNFKA